MIFRSIKTSLTLIVVFFVTIATLVVLGLSVQEHEKLYAKTVKNTLRGLSENLSYELLPSLVAEIPEQQEIDAILSRLDVYENVKLANLYDKEFDLSSQFLGLNDKMKIEMLELLALQQAMTSPSGIYESDDYIISVRLIGENNFPIGYLAIVTDISGPLLDSRNTVYKQTLPLVFGVTLMFLLASIFLLNRLIKPLIALSKFTKRVHQNKDYSLRFQVRGQNEVSWLGRNINAMMETINTQLKKNEANTKMLLEQQETMTKLANYDSLTGLPNRQFVMDSLRLELSRAKRAEKNISLMFFDLDGFKSINDSLGHETGDKVLIEVANRVKHLMRDGDLVSRLGGDEFLIIPDRDVDNQNLSLLAERLIDSFKKPVQINGMDLQVGLSIGIANAIDANYDLNELVSNADIAMYRSKASGRGTFTVFSDDMVEDNKRKLLIANSIITSLSNNEFRVFYQPKVDTRGEVVGYEALLRWEHPTIGLISPNEFIGIAEQGGKIPQITAWILQQVCIEMKTLLALKGDDLRVSVNLSAYDLKNKSLYDYMVRLFEKYEVAPHNFEIEVTEAAYLESFDESNYFFQQLSALGCTVALDDFGTGYSSLHYLTQISINTLKIDRQFINEIESSQRSKLITGTIIDLAKRLNLTICAEGIETEFHQNYLITNGCDQFQGFFYHQPLPLTDLVNTPTAYNSLFSTQLTFKED